MAAANTSGTALTMKLLVDSSPWRPRVVFAEAGKDTVDFLFSLLAMPAGTAVNLLGRESLAGSMGNLYGSAENLDGAYVHPGAANKQEAILCAALQPPAATAPRSWLFRLPEPTPAAPKKLFNCSTGYYSCRSYVTEVSGTRCPNCNSTMVVEARPVGPSSQEAERKGFVQSNVSSMALLSAYAVRCVGALQERTVQIGYKEGVEILRAALQSKTVLTDVFIGKKTPSMSTPSLSSGKSYESLAWRA
ncbi:unnamed protein product [Urochloa humidicola]